jgi:type VI protein secretion system component VasK
MIQERPSIFRIIWTDAAAFMAALIAILLPIAVLYNYLRGDAPSQTGLLMFGGTVLVALAVLVWRLIAIYSLFDNSQEVTATITNLTAYRSRGRVTYDLMVQNQKYTNSNAIMIRGKARELQVGEQKIALVNPENPKKSILRDLYL